MYKTIHNGVIPEKPTECHMNTNLIKKIWKHYFPKFIPIVQILKFSTCVYQPGEKIAVYIVRLQQLTQLCRFGDSSEDMLWNRMTSARLLVDPQLTFNKAMELCQIIESSMQGAKDLQPVQKRQGS